LGIVIVAVVDDNNPLLPNKPTPLPPVEAGPLVVVKDNSNVDEFVNSEPKSAPPPAAFIDDDDVVVFRPRKKEGVDLDDAALFIVVVVGM
jgi:hypothetical protein